MRSRKKDLKDLDNMKKPILMTFIMVPFLTLGGCTTKANNNPEQYESLLKQVIDNSDFHSELYVFPTKINVSDVVAFSYKSREDLFTGSYLFYVVMKYD